MEKLDKNVKLKKYIHKSVFIKFIFSYAVMFIVPVLIGVILYGQIIGIMEDNANRSNVVMLEQLKQVVDSQLKEVNQLADDISLEPKLQSLLNDNELSSQTNAYNFFDFFKDLKKYFLHNKIIISSIYDFYIYFYNSDVILTPSLKTDSEGFYHYIYNYQNVDYNHWMNDIVKGSHYKSYMPSMPVNDGTEVKNTITYTHSFPIGEKNHIKGTLVILIDVQQIKEIIKNIEWSNQGQIYIVNDKNQVIMTTADDNASLEGLLANLSNETSPFIYNRDGHDMMVSFTSSMQTGWKYVTMVSRDVFMSRVNNVRNKGVLIFIIYLPVGIIAIYYMASKNYGPIRDVVDTILGNKSNSPVKVSNEYDFIKKTILDKIKEEKNLSNIVHQQMPVVQANFLQRLIKGYTDESTSVQNTLDFMGIDFISGYFAVLIINIDDISSFAKDNLEKEWVLIRFIISNICSEVISEYHKSYITEVDRNKLAVLVNFDAKRLENALKDIKCIANTLNDLVKTRFKIIITIGASDIHEGFENIGICYKEALSAFEYKIIRGDNAIIYFDETRQAGQNYYYPIEIEMQLINMVKAGDLMNAEKILNELFEINFKSGHIAPEIGKCLFFDIMGTFIKILNSFSEKFRDIFKTEADPIKMLSDCRTIEEMHEKLKLICQEICRYIMKNRSGHSDRLFNNILEYIGKNFGDGMISLNSIAEEFDITPQYLSLFFKKHKGKNINDYITELRIEKAKTLLKDNTYSITQVAQMIGYANDAGLIRVFRKYEGITPGRFRDLGRESKQV